MLGCSLKWFSSIDGIKEGKHASRFFFNNSWGEQDKNSRILLLIPIFLILFSALRSNFYLKLPTLRMIFSKHKLLNIIQFIHAKIISKMDFPGANPIICSARCENLSAVHAGVNAWKVTQFTPPQRVCTFIIHKKVCGSVSLKTGFGLCFEDWSGIWMVVSVLKALCAGQMLHRVYAQMGKFGGPWLSLGWVPKLVILPQMCLLLKSVYLL